MKIAIVTPYDYPYPGGVTEHVRHLDREFRAHGHDTRVIAGSTLADTQLDANVIKVTDQVFSVPFNGSTARIAVPPEDMRELEARLREERFDVIHVHEPAAPFLNWTVLVSLQAVKVGTFHAYVQNRHFSRYLRPVLSLAAMALDGRILVSTALLKTLPTAWLGEYRIIPNGIDAGRFSAVGVRPIPEYADGRPNLLFVGRLEPRKGLPVLLKAYPAVKRAVPDARLLVVGGFSVEERERLAKELESSGLRDVHLVGRVPAEDLPRYYRTATVFCAPSLGGESFGIVLLEAMAAGLPVVASRIAGYEGVMQDGKQGVLVPPGDRNLLASEIVSLLKDPRRRGQMSGEASLTAARYDWRLVAPQVLAYYEELMATRTSHLALPPMAVGSQGT